jgi:Ca2+-binding RTX toxin-like protein
MTTTPTIWKSFIANLNSLNGVQHLPKSTALANGNILVTWTDDTRGPDPGSDIFGQMFDPLGNPIGPEFQINTQSTNGSETNASFAALPDGGFVTVFGATDGDWLRVERYNAFLELVSTFVIEDVDPFNHSIAVAPNGDYMVTFSVDNSRFFPPPSLIDTNLGGVVFDGVTNVPGPRFAAARNSDGYSEFGDSSAVLSSGNFISVHTAFSLDGFYVQFRVVDRNGNLADSRYDVAQGFDPEVAALNGTFVVTYERDGNIYFRMFGNETGAGLEEVVAGSANLQIRPDVVALKDGGFFIAWHDETAGRLFGQRFDQYGAAVGTTTNIAAGGGELGPPDLSLMADGRILVAHVNYLGEIAETILDPRDATFVGTAGNDTIITQVTNSTVQAGAGNDKIFGQRGTDTIDGGDGEDIIQGGDGYDTINAGAGDDLIVLQEGDRHDNVDGGLGRDSLDLRKVTSQGVVIDLGAGTWHQTPGFFDIPIVIGPSAKGPPITLPAAIVTRTVTNVENVFGTAQADLMTGSAAADLLRGELGDDVLNGALGNDSLNGGRGNDLIVGGLGKDQMTGSFGSDVFDFNTLADSVINSALNDVIRDFNANNQDRIDLSGIDAIDGGANDSFVFIGTSAFTAAGQVRMVFFGGNTFVDMNTGGSLAFDSRILLTGTVQLDAADFVL